MAAIFEDFYTHGDETIALYICAASDGRQALRQRLFHRWFIYFQRDDYVKIDDVTSVSDGERYPLSLIIKKNNPYRGQIFEAFLQITSGYNSGK